MVEAIAKRRIELKMSFKELSRKTGILEGAIREAVERGSVDHFTVDQLRRIDRVLGLELTASIDRGKEEQSGEDWLLERMCRSIAASTLTRREDIMVELDLDEEEFDTALKRLRIGLRQFGLTIDGDRLLDVEAIEMPSRDAWIGPGYFAMLSDEALYFLLQIIDEERTCDSWAPSANTEPPNDLTIELLDAGGLEMRDGKARLPEVVAVSLTPLSEIPPPAPRVVGFSEDFAERIGKSIYTSRA